VNRGSSGALHVSDTPFLRGKFPLSRTDEGANIALPPFETYGWVSLEVNENQTELSAMDCNVRDLVASSAGRAVFYVPVFVLLPLLSVIFFLPETSYAGEKPILLLAFTSEGCPACRALEPLISGLEQKQYPIKRVSPHDLTGSALYDHYGISTIPSFVLLSDGVEYSRFISTGEDIQTVQNRLLKMFRSARAARIATAQAVTHPNPLPSPSRNNIVSASEQPRSTPNRLGGPMVDKAGFEKQLTATVRLRIPGGKNETDCGTGTLIHTSLTDHAQEGLVLTCGHLFRDTAGNTPVQVDLYQLETGKTVTVSGECVYYDDDLDIGFVGVPLPFPIEPVRLAPPGYTPQKGDRLVSIGCSSGDDPTLWQHAIKTTNQKFYQPKDRSKNQQFYFIEVTNAPCSGRSGGGLFAQTAQGETYLVGVCNAGDPKSDEGYFLPFSVVYDQLYANSNLAFVYQDLLRGQPIDSESGNIQTVSFDSDQGAGSAQEKIFQPSFECQSAGSRQARVEELKDCIARGAEVICIVNWPKDDQGGERESDIIRVPRGE
jgi:thiol-disulfide isomerase/thioredoxin